MKLSLKGTNLKLLESTRAYVDQKLVRSAKKFIKDGDGLVLLEVEVEKTSAHHKKGEVFRAEANLTMGGVSLRAEATAEGLNEAIDMVEDELVGEIKKFKEKRRAKMLKGARQLKRK